MAQNCLQHGDPGILTETREKFLTETREKFDSRVSVLEKRVSVIPAENMCTHALYQGRTVLFRIPTRCACLPHAYCLIIAAARSQDGAAAFLRAMPAGPPVRRTRRGRAGFPAQAFGLERCFIADDVHVATRRGIGALMIGSSPTSVRSICTQLKSTWLMHSLEASNIPHHGDP